MSPGLIPRVSVVIPTYLRPELLRRCLMAIAEQTLARDEFEVIVVDDGAEREGGQESSIRNIAVCQEVSGLGVEVKYFTVKGQHGPAAARNRGWRESRAEVVAFTDDDTVADHDWLKEGLVALERSRKVALSGRTVVPLKMPPTDYELNESGLARAEFITANCFCRRFALADVGGFDERFTMAWREDSDLQFRLMKAFGEDSIGRAHHAIIIHPVRPASWGVGLRQAKKVLFNALLYKKHPDFYRRRIQKLPPLRYYAMLACLVSALVFLIRNARIEAGLCILVWVLMVAEFTLRRLKFTSRHPLHVLEMLVTSALLAPLAVYWRLYGAFKFRVVFL